MIVSNITLDNGVVSIYFKHTDYCVRTELTFNTYRMYCEFNNLPLSLTEETGEMIIAVSAIQWNSGFNELIAL
jgi:hypothetical protein